MAKLFELPRYIAVEGPIRVGKSTLARVLGERLAAQRVIEPEDNPFLKAFYEGEPGAGFQTQLAFLIRRFEQLRALDLGPKIGAHGGESPADVVPIQMRSDSVEIFLPEIALRMNQLVAG